MPTCSDLQRLRHNNRGMVRWISVKLQCVSLICPTRLTLIDYGRDPWSLISSDLHIKDGEVND